ncbi:membrane peptidoglycan carboxypeptidase [Kribbella sp. VKM Ac-2527]|uniref:Membrane peptidoglycan carboxypeptidase n=1 Tax=Kribbella caucasensis TaxID=2512215 RepID=A0A4R6KSK6_9ACTN|nr:transglycosylase domain-containing protein [Kribbella sp. VKM Ac-2527]TDO54813.1 membrane peptidoglycan carboxypeptidase [Kribbella sp. VKM Ac-2527]
MSEARRKAAPSRARQKKHWALRVLGWLAALFFLGVIGAAATFFIGYQTTDIPDPNKAFQTNTTTVYYADGKTELGTFFEQNRRTVPLAKIPKTVQDAVVAAEDRTFWTNPGISPSGMARAAFNIARGQQLQGGSTITQQYVKIMYLTQERNLSRKFSELFIATKLSRQTDKKEILEGYLNTIYFGEGAYGVAAAGDAYFSEPDPARLTVDEAAFLATVLNNPSYFDPDKPEAQKRILERYRYVLDGMRQTGTISDATYAKSSKKLPPLDKKDRGGRYAGTKGFLLDMARKELERLGIPDDEISGGGLRVVTTFDFGLQSKAVAAGVKRLPKKKNDLHVGIASVKPGTGELVAMYGGPDFLKNQLNWATLRARPGSSFKPFAVAAALKDGRDLYDVYQGDSPIEVQGQELGNEFNRDYGDVTLLKATEQSVNTAFYDLVDNQMENGPAKLVDAAEAAGIPKTQALERGRNNPATVLGPDPYASPVEMANAYATFAAGGMYAPVHTIKTVKTAAGTMRWNAADKLKPTQMIDKEVAKLVNYALQDVVQKGTGEDAKELGRPVAGKTGTAGGVAVEHRAEFAKEGDDCKDCTDTLTSWWTGYTPELSTSVLYRAGKTGESDLDPYSSDPAFFGGNWPVKTWLAYMEPALAGQAETEFDEPDPDSIKNTPTFTPTQTPTSLPTQTPTQTPTNKPTNKPTQTPTNTPTKTRPTKTRETPTWPTIPTGEPTETNTPQTPGNQGPGSQ